MITLASGFPPFSKMWEVLGGVFDDSSIVALAQCHVLKNISYSEERPLTAIVCRCRLFPSIVLGDLITVYGFRLHITEPSLFFVMWTRDSLSLGKASVSRWEESSEMWLWFNYVFVKIDEVSVTLSWPCVVCSKHCQISHRHYDRGSSFTHHRWKLDIKTTHNTLAFSIKYICICKLPQCLHAEHVAVVNISLFYMYNK